MDAPLHLRIGTRCGKLDLRSPRDVDLVPRSQLVHSVSRQSRGWPARQPRGRSWQMDDRKLVNDHGSEFTLSRVDRSGHLAFINVIRYNCDM
jgi:hypothetical protein